MSKFYTGRGDNGSTGLLGNERLPKFSLRIDAIGTLDELNAVFGIVRSQSNVETIRELGKTIQVKMYRLMTEVAATAETRAHFNSIDEPEVSWLEEQIELLSAQVQIPSEFIIPGDSKSGAFIALARTVTRRAERKAAELISNGELENQLVLVFLNRLSSLCFVMELFENKENQSGSQSLVK